MPSANKRSVGLDISDYTIEIAGLADRSVGTRVFALGSAKLEPGIVERGVIKDEDRLKTALKEAASAAKIDLSAERVVFGLPEALVYVHVFSFDPKSGRTLDEAISREAENTIPFRRSDLLYAHKTLGSWPDAKAGSGILLVAALKAEVLRWQDFFKNLGLCIEIFDIESLAIFRGMFEKYPPEPVCLVDIGATTTLVSVFTPLGLSYSYIINSAGNNISYQLSGGLSISFAEAEKLKLESGLGENGQYPQAAAIIKEILAKTFREIKNNIDYFNNEFSFPPVKEIVVGGGTSKLSGLDAYIRTLDPGINIRMGRPFYEADVAYTEAIGLAVRGLNDKWDKTDPVIALPETSGRAEKLDDVLGFIKDLALKAGGRLKTFGTKEYRRLALAGAVFILLFAGFYAFFSYLSSNRIRAAAPLVPTVTERQTGTSSPVIEKPNPTPLIPEAKIIIKDIGSSLNIRSGAGTGFNKIGKAGAGETYVFTEETAGWIKIKLTDGVEGWVFAEYTEKVE